MRDSEGRCSNRVTSAFDDCAAFTARRNFFTSTRDASSLPRQLSSCHLKEPARARSARACCRSYSERQSRGYCSSTDAGDDQPASLPSAYVSATPISSSRTAMRSTIAHGKKRYQPNFRVHPGMDDEPNVGLYRPDRTFTQKHPNGHDVGNVTTNVRLNAPELDRILLRNDYVYSRAFARRVSGVDIILNNNNTLLRYSGRIRLR